MSDEAPSAVSSAARPGRGEVCDVTSTTPISGREEWWGLSLISKLARYVAYSAYTSLSSCRGVVKCVDDILITAGDREERPRVRHDHERQAVVEYVEQVLSLHLRAPTTYMLTYLLTHFFA